MVAQSYATRHPDHPAALILSSTAATATLSRNLAVFERLGGSRAREVAARFYDNAGPETLPEFISECMPLYNRRFSDPDGMNRGILRVEVLFPSANAAPRRRASTGHRSGTARAPHVLRSTSLCRSP